MNTFANRSLPVQLSLAKLFTFRWQFTTHPSSNTTLGLTRHYLLHHINFINYFILPSSVILSYSSLLYGACRTLGSEEGRIYSAFKTAKAFSMSSKLTVPPHMRWAYSGVMPARSIEQERISFSINSRRRATNSSFTLFFIILSMLLRPNHACLFDGFFPPS